MRLRRPTRSIGTGDGVTATFQLGKIYGCALCAVPRGRSSKPVPDSVRIAVAENELEEGVGFIVDTATGVITFLPGHIPASGAAITAGFLFDVPVRFDTDYLEVDLSAFAAGAIPKIPLVEIRAMRAIPPALQAKLDSGVTTLVPLLDHRRALTA